MMNQVMKFTSLLDEQDESDRSSLTLVGSKPPKNFNSTVRQEYIELDPNCLNCQNQTTAEKQILFDHFKMACIQYKPTDLNIDKGDGK